MRMGFGKVTGWHIQPAGGYRIHYGRLYRMSTDSTRDFKYWVFVSEIQRCQILPTFVIVQHRVVRLGRGLTLEPRRVISLPDAHQLTTRCHPSTLLIPVTPANGISTDTGSVSVEIQFAGVRPHAIEKSVRVRRVGAKNKQSSSKKFSFEKNVQF